jgi:serine/threonine-protein kinase
VTVHLRDGQIFGRYKIIRLIGEGGMGAVYEAIHPALKRRFALKTLLPSLIEKEEARMRFLREGQAASSIDHPNVVTVSDVGTEDGIPYLVMEFLDGRTLGDLLVERGALSIIETISLLLPVISAVATGHDRGVIHRDLKPQNIFLSRGPWGDISPKVLDFGVSKFAGDDAAAITRTPAVLGTAAYMSPEQARGAKHVGFKSDQYALGLILYEMVTGSRAHPGDNSLEILYRVASGIIRPARDLRPNLPNELVVVLNRMLAPNPGDRFPALRECGRSLLPLASDKTHQAVANQFEASSAFQGSAVPDDGSAGQEAHGGPEGFGAVAEIRSGGTRVLPIPVATPHVDTTLRHVASEALPIQGGFSMPRGGARRLVRLSVAVVGACSLAGIIVLATRRTTSPSPTSSRPPPREGPTAIRDPSAAREHVLADEARPPMAAPFVIRGDPPDAELVLDNRPPTHGTLDLILPLGGARHEIRVSAAGFRSEVVSFGPNQPPPAEIHLQRAPMTPGSLRSKKQAAPAKARRPSSPASPPRKVDCNPNFDLDGQGEKHFKPECFLNQGQ